MQTTTDTPNIDAWIAEASRLGREAGEAAASWCVDGNSDPQERARVLAMLRDGDPMAWDFLPPFPSLSGEWADDATPLSVAREVTGWDDPLEMVAALGHPALDEIAAAWEDAAGETFASGCERLLIQFCED